MRIWECDMCHKQYKEDGPMVRLTTGDVGWDLCAICFESVKKYINIQGNPQLKRILEYDARKAQCHECRHNQGGACTTPYTVTWDDKFRCDHFEKSEPRKTCNTCVHFMRAKSRCMKKQLPIRENDRDACLGWSDIKNCDNCKWSIAGMECYKERVYCGNTGYCDQWES